MRYVVGCLAIALAGCGGGGGSGGGEGAPGTMVPRQVISYTGPGADGVWVTDDDAVGPYVAYTYDAAGI